MPKKTPKFKQLFIGDTLQSKISKGIAWSFLGTFLSKGLMLLSFILIARIITVEEYGQVGVIRNTIATFAAFSVMSFGVTATKYLAIYKDTDSIRAERILTFTRGTVFIISVLISIIIFVFSDFIASTMLDDISLSFEVEISSFTIFFTALNGYQNGLLAGLEKFKEISFINIFNGILTFPILIIMAYLYQVNGIVIGLVIISLSTWIISDYYIRLSMKKNSLKYRFDSFYKELEIIKNFTLPSFLSGLSITPAILMTNLILAHQDNGYYHLGVFNAAYFFSIITSTINGIIGQVLYPYAMKQYNKDNKRFEYFNIISPWIIGIILNLPLIILPEVMVIFFGSQYDNEDFRVSVVMVALFSIIIAHRQGIARNFAAANLMWWSVFGNAIWGIFLILFTYIFASYGSIGLAIAFLTAYAFNSIIFLPLYLKWGLVKRELLISYPVLIIWLLLLFSSIIYFFIENTFFRVSFLIVILLSINYLFLILWRSYHVK
ncbi:oligosaccharide flippase family protein [Sulfurovum sp. XGS-02]|uniref:oligosaccharide flippase family protein n=1 Tax=Sulfurovum sp. XGS-02 TaxID=2925411 RepID=UPI0020629639|nr:oligosaccharide flippase family protein [Sulfurovum sp. XGS-02]UPT77163.1 oligosaccharide flippase family protein [Sulfurovum sp. XGS-02]